MMDPPAAAGKMARPDTTMDTLPDPMSHRAADHPVEPLFLKRWSPRAMSGEPVSQQDLDRLLEAARWAPSTFNEQEWRFRYAHRESRHWPAFFELLAPANRQWCGNAGVLVVLFSNHVFARNGKVNPVRSVDAGAALENLALQGAAMGLVVHAMAGFDRHAARTALSAPGSCGVEAMIAIGHPGDPAALPEALREREVPSGRRPITEFAGEGPFPPSESGRRPEDREFLDVALAEARLGLEEGGVPIGACLVADGEVIGRGHNRRIQRGSPVLHGEMDALENAGRLSPDVYRQATMYTTLSPCAMCTGAILLYGIPRVVVAESRTFPGEQELLRQRGVEVVDHDLPEAVELMERFARKHPEAWAEDIGGSD